MKNKMNGFLQLVPKTLLLVLLSLVAYVPSAFASSYASLGTAYDANKDNTYVTGSVSAYSTLDSYQTNVYFELYRNGTFLGSKSDHSSNYAIAQVTPYSHYDSGLYEMQWNIRWQFPSRDDVTTGGYESLYKTVLA